MHHPQPRSGFLFGSPIPFPMTIIRTPKLFVLSVSQWKKDYMPEKSVFMILTFFTEGKQRPQSSMRNVPLLKPRGEFRIYCSGLIKLATLVEGDQKATFSIATTPGCRGGCNSVPWIALLYPWSLPLIQGVIKYHFLSFWYDLTWDWTPVFRTMGEHSTY